MKLWIKRFICVALSLLCGCVCIGYAELSDALVIDGKASAKLIEGIFIRSVEEYGTTNIAKNEYSYIPDTTNVENYIRRGEGEGKGTVEYLVTIVNNTDTTYYYRDIYYQTHTEIYNGNDYISDDQGSGNITVVCMFDENDPNAKRIDPRTEKVVRVVYTIGEDISADVDLHMLVNIRFGIHVAGESAAIDAVEKRFLEILNTENTYLYLLDILDNKYDGENEWTSNYVGNVAGATEGAFSDDSVAVNMLFQNQLQMTIDGELKEVTVIVKHEPIDWMYNTGDDYVAVHPSGATYAQTGCEMVLYLTIDPLDVGGAYVPVYAMVFTCDRTWEGVRTSDWYKMGDTYVGTAEVSAYDGTVGGVGSFRTSTWYPSPDAEYTVMAGYHYEIETEYGVEIYHMDAYKYKAQISDKNYLHNVLEAEAEDALPVIAALLKDAERILYYKNFAGEGIDRLLEVYYKYSWPYGYPELEATSREWPYDTIRMVQPAIEDLYQAIDAVLSDISEL